MRRKAKARTMRIASPDDYRRFAEESVQRCFSLPATRKRSRAVQLIMAKAWAKLADQAEEWRNDHRAAA
jgi:predicted ATPase